MDFLGIGIVELLVVLVVALVVLGPAKTMEMARQAGKMLGEVRRAMGDLSQAVEDEERHLDQRSGIDDEKRR